MLTTNRGRKYEIRFIFFILALLIAGVLLGSTFLLFKDKRLIQYAIILIIGRAHV